MQNAENGWAQLKYQQCYAVIAVGDLKRNIALKTSTIWDFCVKCGAWAP
ncbi:MAG: hypothetical protein ACTSO9_21775 [Candidatus Helarchaeota archaeon]